MAIIDILQHYDAKKKAAHAAKTVKHGVCSCGQELLKWLKNNDNLLVSPRSTSELRDGHTLACDVWRSSVCPSAGRSRNLHSEPRAVLQEVLRFHHHYPVIVSRSDRGHRGTWEREGKWKVEQGREVRETKGWIPTARCWFGFGLPRLFFLLIPLFFSLSASWLPRSAAKKKEKKSSVYI